MSRVQAITLWTEAGPPQNWHPTTLDQLGKSEEFFEAALAGTPELLGLQSRRLGIHGPFRVFRQLPLTTPAGRVIYPDIVILAASAHIGYATGLGLGSQGSCLDLGGMPGTIEWPAP
jgi:hypothetical protein